MHCRCSRLFPALSHLLLGLGFFIPALEAQSIRSVSARVDNDFFDFRDPIDDRPDRDYTHGTSLALGFEGRSLIGRLIGLDGPACGRDHGVGCIRSELEVGQRIFTPAVDSVAPVPGERPYAGWLYATLRDEIADRAVSHRFGITVGWTGEPSFGEVVQEAYHELIRRRLPLGWDEQIPFEPGVVLRYDVRRLLAFPGIGGSRVLAVVPRLEAALGTVRTGVAGGADVRVGWNVPHPWDREADRFLGIYGTVGFAGEWVLRDLFLDGSTFGSSHSVDRRPWVGRRRLEIAIRLGPVTAAYELNASTRTYRTQAEPHAYGTFRAELRLHAPGQRS